MRVFLDTNILVSAAQSRTGTPWQAFHKAVSMPHQGLVCTQNIEELRRVFQRKFPHKLDLLEKFLSLLLLAVEWVPVPSAETEAEAQIRDATDRPIFRAALAAGAEVFITGDKDFLEAGIGFPKIMTAVEFLQWDE
jgi:putative PIN family toxin of toxin-antitoxin system